MAGIASVCHSQALLRTLRTKKALENSHLYIPRMTEKRLLFLVQPLLFVKDKIPDVLDRSVSIRGELRLDLLRNYFEPQKRAHSPQVPPDGSASRVAGSFNQSRRWKGGGYLRQNSGTNRTRTV